MNSTLQVKPGDDSAFHVPPISEETAQISFERYSRASTSNKEYWACMHPNDGPEDQKAAIMLRRKEWLLRQAQWLLTVQRSEAQKSDQPYPRTSAHLRAEIDFYNVYSTHATPEASQTSSGGSRWSSNKHLIPFHPDLAESRLEWAKACCALTSAQEVSASSDTSAGILSAQGAA